MTTNTILNQINQVLQDMSRPNAAREQLLFCLTGDTQEQVPHIPGLKIHTADEFEPLLAEILKNKPAWVHAEVADIEDAEEPNYLLAEIGFDSDGSFDGETTFSLSWRSSVLEVA